MKKITWIGLFVLLSTAPLWAAPGMVFQGVRIPRATNGEVSGLTAYGGLKLAYGTAGRVIATDANGVATNTATTAAELAFLAGVTSAIQGQLDAKISNATLVGSTNDLSNVLIARMDAATNALAGVLETRVLLSTNGSASYVRVYADAATNASATYARSYTQTATNDLNTVLRAVIAAATNNSASTAYTDAATNALDGVMRTLITTATNNNATTARTYADAATNALNGVLRTRMDAGTNDLNTVLRALIASSTNTAASTGYVDAATNALNTALRGVITTVTNEAATRATAYANSTTQALAGVVTANLNSASNALYGLTTSGAATVSQLNAASNAIIAFVTPSFTNIPGTVIDWFNPGHYKVISGNTAFTFVNTNESPLGVIAFITAAGGPYGVSFPEVKWLNGTPPTNIVMGVRRYHFYQVTNVIHGEWLAYTTNGNPIIPVNAAVPLPGTTNVVLDFNYPAPTLTANGAIKFVHSTNRLNQVKLTTEFKIIPAVVDRLLYFHNNWAPTFEFTNTQMTIVQSTNGIRLASNMLYYATFKCDANSEDAVSFYDLRGGAFTALPPQLLADMVPGSLHGAYSVARKIRYAYTGPLIRVRASWDNAEVDVNVDGSGNLDTNTMAAFFVTHTSVNGYVVKVYDQDGTGNNDLHSADPAKQPLIYHSSNTVVLASNGRVGAYNFDQARILTNLNTAVNQPLTVYAVMQRVGWTANKVMIGGGTAGNVVMDQTGNSDELRLYAGTYLTPVIGVSTNAAVLIYAKFNSTGSALRVNDSPHVTGDAGTSDPDGVSFLDQSNGFQGSQSYFQEALVYNDAHVNGGSPQIQISDNINAYYIIW